MCQPAGRHCAAGLAASSMVAGHARRARSGSGPMRAPGARPFSRRAGGGRGQSGGLRAGTACWSGPRLVYVAAVVGPESGDGHGALPVLGGVRPGSGDQCLDGVGGRRGADAHDVGPTAAEFQPQGCLPLEYGRPARRGRTARKQAFSTLPTNGPWTSRLQAVAWRSEWCSSSRGSVRQAAQATNRPARGHAGAVRPSGRPPVPPRRAGRCMRARHRGSGSGSRGRPRPSTGHAALLLGADFVGEPAHRGNRPCRSGRR